MIRSLPGLSEPPFPMWTLPKTGPWAPPKIMYSIHFGTIPIVRYGFVRVSPNLFPCSLSSLALFLSPRELRYWIESELHLQVPLQWCGRSQTHLGGTALFRQCSLMCLNLSIWLNLSSPGLLELLWKQNEMTPVKAPNAPPGTEKTS